jgi:hypothetical protein
VTSHFQPGDEVVLRYITRIDGAPGMTWPCRVVRDDDDLLALHIPTGTSCMMWQTPPGGVRELVPGAWRRETLRLMFPGRGYSVWLFWEGQERQFKAFYVNMEEPFRRTPVGFDTNDHALDIVVTPELTWAMKDEEEFEGLVATGHYSPEFAETVRAAAREAIELIECRAAPFNGEWLQWIAADSTTPAIHPRWREEPATLWERREWAYPLAKRLS